MARNTRSEKLIAEFEDGHAKGWVFAVSKAFRDQLDIKYLPKKVPELDEKGKSIKVPRRDEHGNIILKKDGTPQLKTLTKEKMFWTQGSAYCFDAGHILYDTPKAYDPDWITPLQHINIACQVQQAIPAGVTLGEKGMVLFETFKPDTQRKKLVPTGFYRTDQVQFVAFLQSGQLDEAWAV